MQNDSFYWYWSELVEFGCLAEPWVSLMMLCVWSLQSNYLELTNEAPGSQSVGRPISCRYMLYLYR